MGYEFDGFNVGGGVYIANITGVEVTSAITRRLVKEHSISRVDAATALSSFHQDFTSEYRVTMISEAVITRAMAVAETYALRAYDAVQLAAAVETNTRRIELGASPLILVSADTNLLNASVTEGLLIDNPIHH